MGDLATVRCGDFPCICHHEQLVVVRAGHNSECCARVWCGQGLEGGAAQGPDEGNLGCGEREGADVGGEECVDPGCRLGRQGTSHKQGGRRRGRQGSTASGDGFSGAGSAGRSRR